MKIEKLFPKSYIRWIKEKLDYLDLRIDENSFIITQLYFSLIIASITLFVFKSFIIFILSFIVVFIVFIFLLYLSYENSKKQVEIILPEFVSLLSSNLKSGMNLEAAIISSCRKEFGLVDKIFRRIGKEVYSGKPIEEVLDKYSQKYKIDVLQKFLYILKEGIRKGSKISDLLFEISEDLRTRNVLKKELSAIVNLYVMFIFFAAAFGMPILFGITTYFVQTIQTIAPKEFEVKLPINIPLSFKGINIDVDFMRNFAILMIFITSFFSSMMIGALREGNEKLGLKFFPLIFIIAISLYFALQFIISQIMGFLIF